MVAVRCKLFRPVVRRQKRYLPPVGKRETVERRTDEKDSGERGKRRRRRDSNKISVVRISQRRASFNVQYKYASRAIVRSINGFPVFSRAQIYREEQHIVIITIIVVKPAHRLEPELSRTVRPPGLVTPKHSAGIRFGTGAHSGRSIGILVLSCARRLVSYHIV